MANEEEREHCSRVASELASFCSTAYSAMKARAVVERERVEAYERGRAEEYKETRAQWQERSALNSDLNALQSRFSRLESAAREFLEAEAGRPGLRTANARVRLADVLASETVRTPTTEPAFRWHKMHDDQIISEPYGYICLEVERDPSIGKWMYGVYDDGTILYESWFELETAEEASSLAEKKLLEIETELAAAKP